MSHFVSITTELRDQTAIVNALKRMKLIAKCNEKGMFMTDYFGGKSDILANIVVPRSTAKSHADIGFVLENDGTYSIHVDDYDKQKQHNGKFGAEWQRKLCTYYGVERTKIELDKKKLRYVEDLDEKERPRIRVRL
jgi:hypothetical protein